MAESDKSKAGALDWLMYPLYAVWTLFLAATAWMILGKFLDRLSRLFQWLADLDATSPSGTIAIFAMTSLLAWLR